MNTAPWIDSYLDMQAEVGITKHLGGWPATRELLALCRVAEAREVLYVGSGIGVGPAYVARTYGCRVAAVDISEKMLAWSRLRIREERVEPLVELRAANILDLPYPDGRFDAVLVESVVAFVQDKARAIRECMRVAKPGGWVGFNETVWADAAPATGLDASGALQTLGASVLSAGEWQALWDSSGLRERSFLVRRLDNRREIRDRMAWVGMNWALRGFARLFRLFLTRPDLRASLREQMGSDSLAAMGRLSYAIMAGRI